MYHENGWIQCKRQNTTLKQTKHILIPKYLNWQETMGVKRVDFKVG